MRTFPTHHDAAIFQGNVGGVPAAHNEWPIVNFVHAPPLSRWLYRNRIRISFSSVNFNSFSQTQLRNILDDISLLPSTIHPAEIMA